MKSPTLVRSRLLLRILLSKYAQQAHRNLLRAVGHCMCDSERVACRRPRSSAWEFLAIDDHMVAQVCAKQEFADSAPLRDTQIFASADATYPAVGLAQHPKKKSRGVPSGIFLGLTLMVSPASFRRRVIDSEFSFGSLALLLAAGPVLLRFWPRCWACGRTPCCSGGLFLHSSTRCLWILGGYLHLRSSACTVTVLTNCRRSAGSLRCSQVTFALATLRLFSRWMHRWMELASVRRR